MLDFKGQAPKSTATEPPARKRDWFAEFDFLRVLTDFFAGAWSTDRMELRPIPVRVRNRR